MTRLVDMGVEPFLIASSVVGVLAQRLVRVLCPACKAAVEPDALAMSFLGDQACGRTIYEAAGCDECGFSGFKGRTGIYELVAVDDGLRTMIHDRASEQEMTAYARQTNPGIADDGRAKVYSGVTSAQEVMRVSLIEGANGTEAI